MRQKVFRSWFSAAILILAGVALASCDSASSEIQSPSPTTGAGGMPDLASKGGVAPEGQRRAFTRQFSATSGGGINAYLWRAALDTVSFMPIASADSFGGAIITEWYAPPETPNERFKVNVLIQGAALRSDGVKVSLFRQTRDAAANGWTDAPVENNTAIDLENVILTRAREMQQSQSVQ